MPYNYSSRGSRPSRGRQNVFHARPSRRQVAKKEAIHPSRFIKPAKPAQTIEYTPRHAFGDFAMGPLLQRNIQARGFTEPSPIQDQTIPLGLEGRDVIGIANTGTGKTVAFAVPVLNHLINDRTARALIMAPTRELAQQIQDECRMIARGSGLHGAILIGGAPMGPQLRDLSYNPSIVIGTPGRIKDHLERGSLSLARFNMVVLDEVDRMLDMGFVNDMRLILGKLAEVRQSFFFSATLDDGVRALIQTFAHDPVMVSVKTGDTSDNVEQNVVEYGSRDEKVSKLHELLNSDTLSKVLIFDATKRSVERLSRDLRTHGYQADAIHGGKSQAQRQRALNRFKSNDITILVATDVAARGIDVADITHVINYSTPQSYADYVHRIGRAGRAGRTGQALTFVEK